MIQNKKIVLLLSNGDSSRWLHNALKKEVSFAAVIIEEPVSKKLLFKNRIKRIGLFKVMGQTMFSLFVVPILKLKAKKRKAALLESYQLDNSPFDPSATFVSSVNDDLCFETLQKLQPDIVLVNGTRIISKKILMSCNAVFVNMHAGITPFYRGAHGGYWALYNNDEANFGTTIHLVDTGIDTGSVLKQVFAKPIKKDNFTTYPIIQAAEGIQALASILGSLLNNNYTTTQHKEKGKLYYQPTVWEYFKNSTR